MGLNRKVRNGYRKSGHIQKGERLCEYVITVSLKDLEKIKAAAPATGYPPQQVQISDIIHRFPETDHPDFEFDPAVRIFAHPSDLRFLPGNRNTHVHTFVSTKVDGAKLYGFCYTRYRKLRKEDESSFPEVICVISRFPYIEFIENQLKKYPFRPFQSDEGIDMVTNMELYTFLNTGDSPVTVGSLSDELPFVNVDFKHVFVHLHPTNVLKILNAIMCERKILFIASASILVRCIEAFMALIAPFEWPNVYIPIIPSIIQKGQDMSQILIETCFMPFIVGVSKESMEYKDPPRPPKDVVVVDIERDNVMLGDEEIIPFPPKHRKILLDAANDYAVTVLYPEVPQDEEGEKIDKLVLDLALPDSVTEAPIQAKEVDTGLYNMIKTAERGWMLQLKGENVGTDVLSLRKTDHASQLRKRCLIVWASIFRHYKEYITVPTEEQMNNPKFEFFRNEEFMGSIPESSQQFVSHFVKGQMWSWFLQDYCFKSEEDAFDQRASESRKIANDILESQRFHDILWTMPCSVGGGEKIMFLVEMSENQLNFWSINEETSEADYLANQDDPNLMILAHAIVVKADTVLSVTLERRGGFPLSVGTGDDQVVLHAESSPARRSLLEGIRCVILRARKKANNKERGLTHSLSMHHMGSMLKKSRTRAATTDVIFNVSQDANDALPQNIKTPASHALPDFRTPSSPPSPRLLFQEYKRQQMQQELEYNEEIARKESLVGGVSPGSSKGTLGRKINRLFGSPNNNSEGEGSSSPNSRPKRAQTKKDKEKTEKGWRIGTNRKAERHGSSEGVSLESIDPEILQQKNEGNERNEEIKATATEMAHSASKMAAQDSKFLDAILKSFIHCMELNTVNEKAVLDGIYVEDNGDTSDSSEYQTSISNSLLEIQRKSMDLLTKIGKSTSKDQAEKFLNQLRQISKTLKQSTVF